jgi:hypothetical protein
MLSTILLKVAARFASVSGDAAPYDKKEATLFNALFNSSPVNAPRLFNFSLSNAAIFAISALPLQNGSLNSSDEH